MLKRTAAAAFLASAALTTGVAFSQTPPNPTQQQISSSEGQLPLFRITVVGRTTPAINYRPRRGDTKVDLQGTALMPQARGEAKVSGEQGYMNVEAKFDKFDSASRFGREYLTYILWAVTPEGRATNLGEIQIDGNDAKIKVTTELQPRAPTPSSRRRTARSTPPSAAGSPATATGAGTSPSTSPVTSTGTAGTTCSPCTATATDPSRCTRCSARPTAASRRRCVPGTVPRASGTTTGASSPRATTTATAEPTPPSSTGSTTAARPCTP